MSTYKVEICGVNTAQLPILKEEEKEELFKKKKNGPAANTERRRKRRTFQKDKSRRQSIQRNLHQGKSPAGIIRDQTV